MILLHLALFMAHDSLKTCQPLPAVTTCSREYASSKGLHPSSEDEQRKHKKKWLVQSPSSCLMGEKCPGGYKIATIFSHAQTVVLYISCSTVLCQPTGKSKAYRGCSFRRKPHYKSPESKLVGNHPSKHIWIQKNEALVKLLDMCL
ncbi:small ribosomal subunit protein eS27-like [Manis javanica]|uniref:small ribosomal subunit protein eS27-like n=1 Tax=Manis javanica TaxID=9974 RepID=UPI003C6CE967